jgi:hypothetical protein
MLRRLPLYSSDLLHPSGAAIVKRVAGPGSLDCSQQRICCHPCLQALANQDFARAVLTAAIRSLSRVA